MAEPPRDARCLDATVASVEPCGPDAVLLDLALPEPLAPVQPGRFAMLARSDDLGPLIPRPFSIYEQPAPDRLRFLVQVVGPGTRALAALAPGEGVVCTAPLGRGFQVPDPDEDVVLVAGGVGSAPFLAYARRRHEGGAGARTWLLFGARTRERLYDRERLAAAGARLLLATEDGSLGRHGTVLAVLEAALDAGELPAGARFAACGPEGLLRAFVALSRRRVLRAEVSLETYMGCGYGVCNGCVVPATGPWPWRKACLDGPVLSAGEIWPASVPGGGKAGAGAGPSGGGSGEAGR